ncbi:fatty-acyl-CoA synthase [Nonomuraea solani]|uniref:Fatty-acyl-CoA synthase n=1 Tax=Nonomuraea solani TaxID=1144553 RepID=A0A1H6ESL6_9ACTN|nr:acyl-CoA synthetase [Nonomuraea solani]SEH00857.1 fatty-acyl-CoA synthase [Nonomuraea solani]
MSPAGLPPLTGPADLHAIEREPLSGRDLALTTYDLLVRAAQRWPNEPCSLWIPDTAAIENHVRVTFGALLERVHAIAHALHTVGIDRHDAVTLMAPNCGDLLAATLAAEAIGIAAPVNSALDLRHVAHIIRLTGSRVLITAGPELDEELWKRLLDGAAALGIETLVALSPDGHDHRRAPELEKRPGLRTLRLDDLVNGDKPAPAALPTAPPAPDDLAAFFHTGGTTGTPKVAAHTHRNQAVMAWSLTLAGGATAGQSIVAGLPLFHVNALLVTALAPMVTGARSIWPSPRGYRDPKLYTSFWRLVEHYRPRAMSAVPTVYALLAAIPVDADISSLKTPIVGAAPLPDSVRRAFTEATGLELLEGYGLTEGTCASSATLPGDAHPGSAGQRLPYQTVAAAVVDETNGRVRPLPPGETGELVISGPTVFAGYLRRDGDHRRVSDSDIVIDGWLRTGDLGFVLNERIHLRGRQKDLIIRGGHNIDPAIIEDVLLRHPAVSAAAAVGRPDRTSGEVPVAFVALSATDITAQELMAWADEHISEPAARPKTITVLDSIPLTEIGKPFKPALRAQAATGHLRDELTERGIDTVNIDIAHDAGRLVAHLTGDGKLGEAAAILRGYDIDIRTETKAKEPGR